MSHAFEPSIIEREATISTGGRTIRGNLEAPAGDRGRSRLRARQRQRPAQPAQPVRGAGLAGSRPGDTPARPAGRATRPTTAPRSSTSSCWPTGSRPRPTGWPASPRPTGLRLGYFGASTGAGAALLAAARAPDSVGAVVSRGGRPDLARDALPLVAAPTLLIVGGDDEVVLELNREAFDQLTCPRQLDIVPGATHLFPEPGALEEVARMAQEWFLHYLTPSPS